MNGFLRVAVGVPNVKVASCFENAQFIGEMMREANEQQVSLIAFPELSISSCSCGDLYADETLLKRSKAALMHLISQTKDLNIVSVVGLPLKAKGQVINAAVVFGQGQIYGIVPKKSAGINRYFSVVTKEILDYLDVNDQDEVMLSTSLHLKLGESTFTVRFAEDLLSNAPHSIIETDDFIVLLSAQSEIVGKSAKVLNALQVYSEQYNTAFLYSAPGYGESTTDDVFVTKSAIIDDGIILAESELDDLEGQLLISELDIAVKHSIRMNGMGKDYTQNCSSDIDEIAGIEIPNLTSLFRTLDRNPFVPAHVTDLSFASDALSIQAIGLVKRLKHIRGNKVVLGVSGGLDSTLALLVCMRAIDLMKLPRKNIIGITMPGFGTSGRTKNNADVLMEQMGITIEEISIKDACIQHFKDINHDLNTHDVTFENSQARERTQILMDYANKHNALVIGTGDLSELALGWATYNGDHMSMYGVNASIPKTLVQYLVRAIAKTDISEILSKTLLDILDTPISPELTPTSDLGIIQQKTEDLVGPYELHDFFIFYMMKYGFTPTVIYERAKLVFGLDYEEFVIKKWLKTFYHRFFMQQFKRSCSPDGPNVTGISLSPRGGWIMPSDVVASVWLDEVNLL